MAKNKTRLSIFEELAGYAIVNGRKVDPLTFAFETGRTFYYASSCCEAMEEAGFFRFDWKNFVYRMVRTEAEPERAEEKTEEKRPQNRASKSLKVAPRKPGYAMPGAPSNPLPPPLPVAQPKDFEEPVLDLPDVPVLDTDVSDAAESGRDEDLPVYSDAYEDAASMPEPVSHALLAETGEVEIADIRHGEKARQYQARPGGNRVRERRRDVREEADEQDSAEMPLSLEDSRERIRRYVRNAQDENMINWTELGEINIPKRHIDALESEGFLRRDSRAFIVGNGSKQDGENGRPSSYDGFDISTWRALSQGETTTSKPAQKPSAGAENIVMVSYFLERGKPDQRHVASKEELLAAGFTEDSIRDGLMGNWLGSDNGGYCLLDPALKKYPIPKPDEIHLFR